MNTYNSIDLENRYFELLRLIANCNIDYSDDGEVQSISEILNLLNKLSSNEKILNNIEILTLSYIYIEQQNPSQILDVIVQNMPFVIDSVDEICDIAFLEKIQKLIALENKKISYINSLQYHEDLKNEKNLQDQLVDLSDQCEKLNKQQKNITKDYIAILGIFAAIFMAFDSGLKIELEILNQVNDYAKGILIIFIALFTYALLKSFYTFIANVYTNKTLEETTKITSEQVILLIILILLAGIYCYLIYHIDEQYEQKIKPIVKEEMSKLQQKEEKERIIIHNNTSSTQNQENGLVQQQKIKNKQSKNNNICKPVQK